MSAPVLLHRIVLSRTIMLFLFPSPLSGIPDTLNLQLSRVATSEPGQRLPPRSPGKDSEPAQGARGRPGKDRSWRAITETSSWAGGELETRHAAKNIKVDLMEWTRNALGQVRKASPNLRQWGALWKVHVQDDLPAPGPCASLLRSKQSCSKARLFADLWRCAWDWSHAYCCPHEEVQQLDGTTVRLILCLRFSACFLALPVQGLWCGDAKHGWCLRKRTDG